MRNPEGSVLWRSVGGTEPSFPPVRWGIRDSTGCWFAGYAPAFVRWVRGERPRWYADRAEAERDRAVLTQRFRFNGLEVVELSAEVG